MSGVNSKWACQPGAAPGMSIRRAGVECPYIGAPPGVQWRRLWTLPWGSRAGTCPRHFPGCVVARGDLRSGNSGAVAPAHQHAILRPAHVSDTRREPDPDRDQGDGESKGGDVGQHPVPEIVGIPGHLISREIIRWRRFCRVRLLRRLAGDAAPKFQDAVLVWRWDRLLMRHGMPAGDEVKRLQGMSVCPDGNASAGRVYSRVVRWNLP